MTTFLNDDLAPADSDEQAEAMAHDALVFDLSVALARLDGCDDPHHLIWEGGPVPEPWGEVWQRYEPQAKEVLSAIGDGLAQAMVEALRPTAGVPGTEAPRLAVADLDVEVLRSFSDRMAASYEAAQQYAYCPSSDPYRRLMKQAREAKRGLDACYNAAGVKEGSDAR